LLLKRTTGVLLAVGSGIVLVGLIILLLSTVSSRPAHHTVKLNWNAPVPSTGVSVTGYNVYRSVTPGGPYARIATGVTGLTYHDPIVNNGTTYYYVVTSVATNGRESTFSTEVPAKIP